MAVRASPHQRECSHKREHSWESRRAKERVGASKGRVEGKRAGEHKKEITKGRARVQEKHHHDKGQVLEKGNVQKSTSMPKQGCKKVHM